MAKTPKFLDEKLLEAVVKYADQYSGKIEATKLARWAAENVGGLEGVEDRHFMRPADKKDPKTGKTIKSKKLCTLKIEELNAARSTVASMKANILLRSVNVDEFFALPTHQQRNLILKTREQVDSLTAENMSLRAENKAVSAKTKALSTQVNSLDQTLKELKTDHEKLLVLITRAMKTFDAGYRKKMLESIGVCDGLVDLDTYADRLSLRIHEVSSINAIIKEEPAASEPLNLETLIEGIAF